MSSHAPRMRRGESPAEELAGRLDRPMGLLGLLFVLVVTGQLVATSPGWSRALSVAGWLLWGVFVAEFALRAYVAQDQSRFWRRNWWQLVFLALPFLRFARALTLLRTARLGGVLSSTLRGSRSAGRLLTGRLGWLGVVTAVVVMGASQLLFVAGAFTDYGRALHGAALATVTGEPLAADGAVPRVLEVVLAIYSVVVFATLAGALGAFFLQNAAPEQHPADSAPSSATDDGEGTPSSLQ